MDAVKSLNGEMWIFASLLIAVVILQAVLFLRLALRVNKKHQYFTREEIGHFLKMGSLSVLGPAFSVVVVAISLIAMVGSGLTFMRVGVIGAASYEMMIATTAAETIGVPFGFAGVQRERAGAAAGEPCLHLPVLLRNPDCRRDGGAGGLLLLPQRCPPG